MTGTNEVARPPVVNECPFDPLNPEQLRDPHPWLSQARKAAPVFYVPEVDEWWVTRYDDCLTALRDTATYSSRNVIEFQQVNEIEELLPDGDPRGEPLVNTDPPEHSRLRGFAQRAFTAKAVAEYEPEARRLADELVDGFIGARSADLYQEFAQPLTMQMICGIMGIPTEEVANFGRLAGGLVEATEAGSPSVPAAQRRAAAERVLAYDTWLRAFIAHKRETPGNDLTSRLVTATSDDSSPALTTREVVRLVSNLFFAGFENSASLIGAAIFALLRDRALWEKVKADPGLVPMVIEEALRAESPARGLRRYVTRDTVLAGIPIPQGSTVILAFASAMRDETVFSDPDTFNLERQDVNKHFSLGKWTHFCLGAPLARMEGRVALECLIRRLPDLRLGEGEQLQNRRAHRILTALQSLSVTW